MDHIILYGNGCPKCKVLEQKLKQANIKYSEVSDIDAMISKGFISMPVLEINGKIFKYSDAIKEINERM